MSQSDLERAVASVTGESVNVIRRRGFSLANPFDLDFDPEPDERRPLTVDWDELECRRARVRP